MTIHWPRFCDLIRTHHNFVLTSHVRPDCDALGSELGMAGILERLGKQVRIVNAQATPANLAFIDPDRKIKALGTDVTQESLNDADAMMVLDTSAWAQLGSMADVLRGARCTKMLLDHHMTSDDLQVEEFRNVQAEATGRLVVEAAEALSVPLFPEVARPLFAAVATDTGWFRFSSVSSETYRVAAKLIDAGARPSELYAVLYEQDTLARMRLRGLVLQRITSELNGRLAHTYIRRQDFTDTGSVPADTEDLINSLLAVKGTEVAVILVESVQGSTVKVSFRSRSAVDCSQLAARFGGGGHKAAAGATIPGDLPQAQPLVLDAVRAAM